MCICVVLYHKVVNGPVITSISVLFATLVSTTVSSLHARQMEIKSWYTKQVDELRLLQVILKQMPPSLRQDARTHVHEYVDRLVGDKRGEKITHELDPSLRNLLLLLQQAMMDTSTNMPLLNMAYEVVTRIQQARCSRWTALQTKFPAMHYVTLTLLALAICVSFLVATDQSQNIFESVQVRILWTILIGGFTSLAVVCYDLSSPFVGAYQVSVRVCWTSRCTTWSSVFVFVSFVADCNQCCCQRRKVSIHFRSMRRHRLFAVCNCRTNPMLPTGLL